MLAFTCPEHGEFDYLHDLGDGDIAALNCPDCGTSSSKVTSYAVRGRIKMGEATQGKVEPTPNGFVSTEALADGMPGTVWRRKKNERRRDARVAEIKANI